MSAPEVVQALLEHRRSMRGVATELRTAVHYPMEWRLMVRHLYIDLGRPPVAGYSAAAVHRILWGEQAPEIDFFAALMTALLDRYRPQPNYGQYSYYSAYPTTVVSTTPIQATYDSDLLVQHLANLPAGELDTLGKWLGVVAQGGSAKPAAKAEAIGQHEPAAEEPAKPMFMPPDPDTVTNVADFMEAAALLKRWSGLSLRHLELRTRGMGRVWLSRSTISDMLKRPRPPKPEVLRAFTAACGLPPTDQDRWQTALARLEMNTDTRAEVAQVEGVSDDDGQPTGIN